MDGRFCSLSNQPQVLLIDRHSVIATFWSHEGFTFDELRIALKIEKKK